MLGVHARVAIGVSHEMLKKGDLTSMSSPDTVDGLHRGPPLGDPPVNKLPCYSDCSTSVGKGSGPIKYKSYRSVDRNFGSKFMVSTDID